MVLGYHSFSKHMKGYNMKKYVQAYLGRTPKGVANYSTQFRAQATGFLGVGQGSMTSFTKGNATTPQAQLHYLWVPEGTDFAVLMTTNPTCFFELETRDGVDYPTGSYYTPVEYQALASGVPVAPQTAQVLSTEGEVPQTAQVPPAQPTL